MDYHLFLAGPPLIEALSGGRLDFLHTGDMPSVSGRSAGIDLKVIANAGFDPAHDAVLVAPDSPIKSPQELRGKKVAVPLGSSGQHFLFLLLAKAGLKPADIQMVNLPATELAKALETRNVDAVAAWEPYTANIELGGQGKVLADAKDIKHSVNVYVTRNEFAKANPQLVQSFLRATKRAIDFYRKDPRAAQASIAAEGRFHLPVVARITQRCDWSMGITEKDVEALNQVKDFLRQTKVLRRDFDIHELFDASYLHAAGIQ